MAITTEQEAILKAQIKKLTDWWMSRADAVAQVKWTLQTAWVYDKLKSSYTVPKTTLPTIWNSGIVNNTIKPINENTVVKPAVIPQINTWTWSTTNKSNINTPPVNTNTTTSNWSTLSGKPNATYDDMSTPTINETTSTVNTKNNPYTKNMQDAIDQMRKFYEDQVAKDWVVAAETSNQINEILEKSKTQTLSEAEEIKKQAYLDFQSRQKDIEARRTDVLKNQQLQTYNASLWIAKSKWKRWDASMKWWDVLEAEDINDRNAYITSEAKAAADALTQNIALDKDMDQANKDNLAAIQTYANVMKAEDYKLVQNRIEAIKAKWLSNKEMNRQIAEMLAWVQKTFLDQSVQDANFAAMDAKNSEEWKNPVTDKDQFFIRKNPEIAKDWSDFKVSNPDRKTKWPTYWELRSAVQWFSTARTEKKEWFWLDTWRIQASWWVTWWYVAPVTDQNSWQWSTPTPTPTPTPKITSTWNTTTSTTKSQTALTNNSWVSPVVDINTAVQHAKNWIKFTNNENAKLAADYFNEHPNEKWTVIYPWWWKIEFLWNKKYKYNDSSEIELGKNIPDVVKNIQDFKMRWSKVEDLLTLLQKWESSNAKNADNRYKYRNIMMINNVIYWMKDWNLVKWELDSWKNPVTKPMNNNEAEFFRKKLADKNKGKINSGTNINTNGNINT